MTSFASRCKWAMICLSFLSFLVLCAGYAFVAYDLASGGFGGFWRAFGLVLGLLTGPLVLLPLGGGVLVAASERLTGRLPSWLFSEREREAYGSP